MADNRRFRRGSGTYKCVVCGQLTRETGEGESSVEMCKTDYFLEMLYNTFQDDEITEAEYKEQAAEFEKGRPEVK